MAAVGLLGGGKKNEKFAFCLRKKNTGDESGGIVSVAGQEGISILKG